MRDFDESLRKLRELQAETEQRLKDLENGTQRIRVSRKTHRVGFEGETEESVTVVIEKKDNE